MYTENVLIINSELFSYALTILLFKCCVKCVNLKLLSQIKFYCKTCSAITWI